MPRTYGPWEPYTQTDVPRLIKADTDFEFGLAGGRLNIAARSYLQASTPHDQIWQDPDARICVIEHLIFGSSMDSSWATGFGSCPALTPLLYPLSGLDGPAGVGMTYSVIGGFVIPSVEAHGRIAFATAIANNDISDNGIPSWQDPQYPEEDPAPLGYEYQFTALSGTITMVIDFVDTSKSFELYGNRVVPGTEDSVWQDGDVGTRDWTAVIDADGSSTVLGGARPLTNIQLQEGVAWQFVANCIAPGFFNPDNDPGTSSFSIYAQPRLIVTSSRSGLRREILTDTGGQICPPLQQIQRGDGLGGGPPRTGKGDNSRQGLLFGRGVF